MDPNKPAPAESMDPAATLPASNPGTRLKLILGLVLVGCFGLTALAGSVYFAFDYIRESVLAVTTEIPVSSNAPVYNQIAFIGNDFNLWLVKPDGTNQRRITTDGRTYRFPTWSPDGRYLAFLGRGDSSRTVLYLSPTDHGVPTVAYSNAASPPFYLYWSPDSKALTFLTQEVSGLALRLIEPANPERERVMGVGSPFYWAWSPHSDKLLLHVGGSRISSKEAHISLLDNEVGANRVELDLRPGRFQTPLWASDGRHFYTIALDDNVADAIYEADAETLDQRKVVDLSGFSLMVLSPSNRQIAYLQLEQGISPPFGLAYLVNVDGTDKKQIMNSPVASIYWSPDGKKLALLSLVRPLEGPTAKAAGLAAPLAQGVSLRWWVYNVENDELQPLFTFDPTTAFLQTIPYFDQYHLSLTFWSPDSRFLVVTKAQDDQNILGGVYVVDTEGKAEPQKVGEGTLAVWSWQ